ncbi:MAG: hypothetical protein ACK5FF_16510, partial [Planctomyces sp.]
MNRRTGNRSPLTATVLLAVTLLSTTTVWAGWAGWAGPAPDSLTDCQTAWQTGDYARCLELATAAIEAR